MPGLNRFLSILRRFGEEQSNWTVQQLAEALGVPTSTAYRTVKELVATGFLEPSVEAHYRLGSAFVEFDRTIRLTDPLVKVGAPLLRDLVAEVTVPCVSVLARLYGDRVICAVDERPDAAGPATSYERGRPMPLTRGATSKAILAQLDMRRLRKLLGGSGEPDKARALAQFRIELTEIRKKGYCITRGEVDQGLVGIAVPVSNQPLAISASLSLILQADQLTQTIERRLVLQLVSAAHILTTALRQAV